MGQGVLLLFVDILPIIIKLVILVIVYILIDVNFYPYDSGGLPAYTINWNAQIQFLNGIRLTSDHVLF